MLIPFGYYKDAPSSFINSNQSKVLSNLVDLEIFIPACLR